MVHYRFALILLYCVLFWGNFAYFATAEVVNAYRTPSEADLQWLFGDDPDSVSNVSNIPSVLSPSDIVQTGHRVLVKGYSCDPCKPVNSPQQSVPPAPKVADCKATPGIAPEEEGVSSISPTVTNSTAPIAQMSGDRLPPPSGVPKEQNPAIVPSTDSPVAPLPTPGDQDLAADTPKYFAVNSVRHFGFNTHHSGVTEGCSTDRLDDLHCICLSCILCGDHRHHNHYSGNACSAQDDEELSCSSYSEKCTAIFNVPDMIGGRAWYTGYQLPTMLLTRPNVGEHFNAVVQNRIWADYRCWNNAVAVENEVRSVEQFSFGWEKLLMKKCSVELRVPLLYQYASNQVSAGATAVELGNISVFMKHVVRQNARWTLASGCGVTLPTAEDWRGELALNNNIYYLASFLGAQWHPNKSVFGHFIVQADVSIDGNRQKFGGQQVIHSGLQLGRWIYRADYGKRPCRFGGFAEVNYAAVTEGSAANGMLNSNRSALTMAIGMPMVFGKLTCTNALVLPVQINDRQFSVGYNFSLSRQF